MNAGGSTDTPRLTAFSSCAGCAAKIGQRALAELVRGLAIKEDSRMLVGLATGDDAGVYRLDNDRALVQTLDFFTPIVDDPRDFGRIAATNALSDVYAMGARPLTAMNIVGFPEGKLPPEVAQQILRGGADVVKAADCCLIGGHSIRSPEPIFGLSVTGIVHPDRLIANSSAKPGDLLVLTKPLGTGIATTALKRNLAPAALVAEATRSMCTLNLAGAMLAEAALISAGTDVTGFGLIGHLSNICRESRVSAQIDASSVPCFGDAVWQLVEQNCVPGGTRVNMQSADESTDWDKTSDAMRILLCDAQTSGPLLLCVPPENKAKAMATLQEAGSLCQAVIGRIIQPRAATVYVQ